MSRYCYYCWKMVEKRSNRNVDCFFSFTSLHLYVFSVVSSIQMKDCVQWCSEDCCEYSKYQWILVLLINSFVKEIWKLGTCLKRLSLLLLLVFDAYKEKLKSDNVTKFLNTIYWHPSLIWDYTIYEFNSSILSFFFKWKPCFSEASRWPSHLPVKLSSFPVFSFKAVLQIGVLCMFPGVVV